MHDYKTTRHQHLLLSNFLKIQNSFYKVSHRVARVLIHGVLSSRRIWNAACVSHTQYSRSLPPVCPFFPSDCLCIFTAFILIVTFWESSNSWQLRRMIRSPGASSQWKGVGGMLWLVLTHLEFIFSEVRGAKKKHVTTQAVKAPTG